jgi:hypothetical protein
MADQPDAKEALLRLFGRLETMIPAPPRDLWEDAKDLVQPFLPDGHFHKRAPPPTAPTRDEKGRKLQPWHCISCGAWVWQARKQFGPHSHPGSTNFLMPAQPVDIVSGDQVAIRALRDGRFRAVWLIQHTGYIDRPAWGHDPGATSHYHYRAIRDAHGKYVDFASKEEAFAKLRDADWLSGRTFEPCLDVDCGGR